MEPTTNSFAEIDKYLSAEEATYRVSRSCSPQKPRSPKKAVIRLGKHNNRYMTHLIDYFYEQVKMKTHRNEEWKASFLNFCENNQIDIITTPEKYIPVTFSSNAKFIISNVKFWYLLIEFYTLKYPTVFTLNSFIKLSNYALNYITYLDSRQFITYFNDYITTFNKKLLNMYINAHFKNVNPNQLTDYSFLITNTTSDAFFYSKKIKKPTSKYESNTEKLKENSLNKTFIKSKGTSTKKSIISNKRSPSPIRKNNILSSSINKNKTRGNQSKKSTSRNMTPLRK